MSFSDIKGQDRAISFLKASIANNRVSHAYIFWGPGGIGKALTALNFAKALNCENKGENMPCDQCASCKRITSSNHPDIFLIKPQKDENSDIGIERIGEMIKDITLKPYGARKKVYIIDGAGGMTQDAQNALLKTLEEPPSESVLILLTEFLSGLLPTIQSRGQAVKFFALGIDEVRRILVEEYKIDNINANILAYLSSGRLGEALLYRGAHLLEKRSWVIKALADKTLFDSDFDKFSKRDLKFYLDVMLTWYRDILIAKTRSSGKTPLVNIDKEDIILSESKTCEVGELGDIIKQIILTNFFLEQNANPKLAIAALGANICMK